MKTNYLILNLILILSSFVYGQDYQTITSNRIVYFANQFNNIKCIRIDSIKNQTDSIFFPFSNIKQIDYNCYTPYGASWIGQKVILKEDGKNIFFNKFNDSIIVKENALLNESWTMFNLIDSIKVIATIIKHDTMSFISLHDSVKTIGFQVYDKNMNPLNYNINNYKLLLSKNYGFVRIFNFYLFPDNQVDYPYSQFEELTRKIHKKIIDLGIFCLSLASYKQKTNKKTCLNLSIIIPLFIVIKKPISLILQQKKYQVMAGYF